MKALRILCIALALTTSVSAQDDCPRERARTVPDAWTTGSSVSCDTGIDLQLGGLHVVNGAKSCPLFVLITPAHEVGEPAPTRTRVVQSGQVNQVIAFFRCTSSYFLFISLGSSCQLDQVMPNGTLPRLRTEACPPLTEVPV